MHCGSCGGGCGYLASCSCSIRFEAFLNPREKLVKIQHILVRMKKNTHTHAHEEILHMDVYCAKSISAPRTAL